jgi:hypothetical protein
MKEIHSSLLTFHPTSEVYWGRVYVCIPLTNGFSKKNLKTGFVGIHQLLKIVGIQQLLNIQEPIISLFIKRNP